MSHRSSASARACLCLCLCALASLRTIATMTLSMDNTQGTTLRVTLHCTGDTD